MSRFRVVLFGPAREAIGAEEAIVDAPSEATAGSVISALAAKHPELEVLLPRARVAVNREYVDAETPVTSSDEIAVIPPVGGG